MPLQFSFDEVVPNCGELLNSFTYLHFFFISLNFIISLPIISLQYWMIFLTGVFRLLMFNEITTADYLRLIEADTPVRICAMAFVPE